MPPVPVRATDRPQDSAPLSGAFTEVARPRPAVPMVAAISREIVKTYADLLGRGPTRARTRLADDHVLCVLGEALGRSERVLVDAGRADQVIEMRRHLHEQMAPRLTRIVEEETGRRVGACLGQIDPVADLAIEFFSFVPGDPIQGR